LFVAALLAAAAVAGLLVLAFVVGSGPARARRQQVQRTGGRFAQT
jgi:hypothetical protein